MAEADARSSETKRGELHGVLPAGLRLRSYEIMGVLGQGGFGITYRARDTTLNRDVAIKEYLPISLALRKDSTMVIPRSTELAEEFVWGRERFLEEARTLATLGRARAVVRIHDFLEANGTAYIVMELAAGETLDQRLKRGGPLPPPAIERILPPLLDGLERVHGVGFLHRDIKPTNIILDDEGYPTLIDFGAARAAIAGRSTAMTAIFTPGYAALEQFTSARQEPATDIYGLSATLYRAIAGKEPPSAIDRMMKDTHEPLSLLLPAGFAPGLLSGIDAGLGLKSDQRPQSIAEWRPLLEQARVAMPRDTVFRPRVVPAGPTTAPASARPVKASNGAPAIVKSTRRPLLWAGVAAAVLLLGGGYGMFVAPRPATVSTAVQSLTAEELTRALDERRKADALAKEKKKLEEGAHRKAEADAESKRKADETLLAAQQQRQKAEEELAKLKAEMETRRQAEAAQRDQAASAAQRLIDEAGKRNQAETEMAALRKTEEDAKQRAAADALAKQQADEAIQLKAEAEAAAKHKAEAEAGAKRKADDDAKAVAAAEKQKIEAAAAAEKRAAEATETGLHLAQTDRQRLQVALTSGGFNTNGSDGVFGPHSRDMIAAWQKARNLPATGFLSGPQQAALLKEAAPALTKYDEDQKKVEDDKKKAEEEAKAKAQAAAAVSSRLAGAWYGKLERWDIDTDRRDLVVAPDGSCRWDLPKPGGPGRAKSCTVDDKAGTIDLITGADASVKLRLSGTKLEGLFQLKGNGRTYQVAFRREPYEQQAVAATALSPPAAAAPATSGSIAYCEQAIPYTITPPGGDVPKEYAAFSGVWTGAWGGQLCSALIVEAIAADGSMRGKYVIGTNPGGSARANTFSVTGQIANGRLSLRGTYTSTIEYRLASASELAGDYSRPGVRSSGTFKKRTE